MCADKPAHTTRNVLNRVENMSLMPVSTNCTPAKANCRLQQGKPARLEIKKDPKGMVTVPGATVLEVTSAKELLDIIDRAQQRRHVSSTQMNRESSRSHLIMSIVIESTNLQTQNMTKGKLSFVDLAGSERCGWKCLVCACV